MRARFLRPGPVRLVWSIVQRQPTSTPLFVCRHCAASFSSSSSPRKDDDPQFRQPFAPSLDPFAPRTYERQGNQYPLPPREVNLLYGKTAVITGGSRGIGWAIAARLAQEGVACTLVGRDEEVLQRAVRSLPRPFPPQYGPLKVPLVPGMPTGYVPRAAAGVRELAGKRPDEEDGEGEEEAEGKEADKEEGPFSAPPAGGPRPPPIEHGYLVGDVRDEALWRDVFAWEEEEPLLTAEEAETALAERKVQQATRAERLAQMAKLAQATVGASDARIADLLSSWAGEAIEQEDLAAVQAQQQQQQQQQQQPQQTPRGADGAARGRLKDVHLLVNAAGVMHTRPIARLSPADIRTVLDTNLLGTTLGCAYAMKAWVRRHQKKRCIINIASLLATHGGAGASVYAASKAGVIGLTRGLAAEGAGPRRLIRANVILPGYIHTDMINFLTGERLDAIKKKIPATRLGSAFEVADAALFLAKNDYANNCVLNLDGGLSATL